MIGSKNKTKEQIQADYETALKAKQELEASELAIAKAKQEKHEKRVADERDFANRSNQFGIDKPLAYRLTLFMQTYKMQVDPANFDKYAAMFGLTEYFAEINKNDKGKKTKPVYNDQDEKIN